MNALPWVMGSMSVALAILATVTLGNRRSRRDREPSDRTP
jgi:hypothetical protein